MAQQTIDLNCDMGESPDGGNDAAILDFVTSANIACGFHAGDATTMSRTIEMALKKGIAVGAHPSFADREGFGRRGMTIPLQEIYEIVLHQVGAIAAIAKAAGGKLAHVKPHGALYNMAARDTSLAQAIAKAVRNFDDKLILYGLSGSASVREAEAIGLRTASEVFADRRYRADGSLMPRGEAGAVIKDVAQCVRQALRMANEGTVEASDGSILNLTAETICIHGDEPNALDTARAISKALRDAKINIRAPG